MTPIEPPTTYEAWRETVCKAQEESIRSGRTIYIYFRKAYGWSISDLGGWHGDHYAVAVGMNRVGINKTVAKKLGRLWLR